MLKYKIINLGFFKVACFVVLSIRLPLSFFFFFVKKLTVKQEKEIEGKAKTQALRNKTPMASFLCMSWRSWGADEWTKNLVYEEAPNLAKKSAH